MEKHLRSKISLKTKKKLPYIQTKESNNKII